MTLTNTTSCKALIKTIGLNQNISAESSALLLIHSLNVIVTQYTLELALSNITITIT